MGERERERLVLIAVREESWGPMDEAGTARIMM
jgi:hypothetical protein